MHTHGDRIFSPLAVFPLDSKHLSFKVQPNYSSHFCFDRSQDVGDSVIDTL